MLTRELAIALLDYNPETGVSKEDARKAYLEGKKKYHKFHSSD